MRRLARTVGASALIVGSLLGAPTATAAQLTNPAPAPAPVPVPERPTVQLLDCYGSTGWMGCGPGWTWRDGWRGFACYVC
ncbi:MAG: hypothetical protein PGN37_00615 [Mycobacterium kyogaense]|jgi:hypothetical protein|uniref:hypothetical protein n=1 Tax=Mycobacterium kyogaense TaxID=2212479 RepID=UPI002FFB30F8